MTGIRCQAPGINFLIPEFLIPDYLVTTTVVPALTRL
jgi:hypothetical protein